MADEKLTYINRNISREIFIFQKFARPFHVVDVLMMMLDLQRKFVITFALSSSFSS